jgi:ribosomal protein L40E
MAGDALEPASICRKCGWKSPPSATFCSHCGTHFVYKCWNCEFTLQGYEIFCPHCGVNVEGPTAPRAKRSVCKECEHYRGEVPVSTLLQLHAANGVPSEPLLKIREEEVKIRDKEAGLMASQVTVGRIDWGLRPLMWQYCAEKADQDVYEIVELKNKNSDCAAFHQREHVRPTECMKCQYRNRPSNRYSQAFVATDPKIFHDVWEAIKKDFEAEVMAGWTYRGMLPGRSVFEDWCSWYSEGARSALCAYMNPYGMCSHYSPLAPEFDIHKV